jgi:hypothetical protein
MERTTEDRCCVANFKSRRKRTYAITPDTTASHIGWSKRCADAQQDPMRVVARLS